jgi:hypothetical protein
MFKAVLVSEAEATSEWRGLVSDWLVRSGCRYFMAWGRKCREWHDSVDEANLQRFDDGEFSDDDLVMTTWHEDEPVEEVFWFSQFCAMHPSLEIGRTYIVHVSREAREVATLQTFAAAQESTDD